MQYYNRVKFATATQGTGPITVGLALTGFRTPADAGIPDAAIIRYVIEDPPGSANWETGYGTYTVSGTTLSRNVMQSSNGDALLSLSGNAVVRITALAEDISGMGSSAFILDIPPVSPHAKDDEFGGASLDAKWTSPATATCGVTVSVANGWLRLEPADAGSASTGKRGGYGIRQTAPTGSFTISAKIVNAGHIGDEARVGIFVARTANSTATIAGGLRTYTRVINVSGLAYSESADWGAYDGYDSSTIPEWPGTTWFKIQWDSVAARLTFYYSVDGNYWTYYTYRDGTLQPDRIGIAMWGNSANLLADHVLGCDWFRVTEP